MYVMGKHGVPSILGERTALNSETTYVDKLLKGLAAAGMIATSAACEMYRDRAPAWAGGWEATVYDKALAVKGLSNGALSLLRTGQHDRTITGATAFFDDNGNGKEDPDEIYRIVFTEGDSQLLYDLLKGMQGLLNAGRTPLLIVPTPAIPPGSASSAALPSGYYPVTKGRTPDRKTVWYVNSDYARYIAQDEHPIEPAGTKPIEVKPPLKRGGTAPAPPVPPAPSAAPAPSAVPAPIPTPLTSPTPAAPVPGAPVPPGKPSPRKP